MDKSYILTHEETLTIENILGSTGSVIAFPTDTVYGLGCLLENEEAVRKIFDIKGRDIQKPLILLGSSIRALEKYVKFIPDVAHNLIQKHWPGALTIILPKSRYVPDYVTANSDTVGIRVPKHPVLLELLRRCTADNVLVSTSANISNQPDLVSYEQVKKALGDKVDYLVEDYNIPISGIPSTIISVNKDNSLKVLRQGSIVID